MGDLSQCKIYGQSTPGTIVRSLHTLTRSKHKLCVELTAYYTALYKTDYGFRGLSLLLHVIVPSTRQVTDEIKLLHVRGSADSKIQGVQLNLFGPFKDCKTQM